MRVLHVVPSLGPAYGGISKGVRELSAAQTTGGLQVDIAATNVNGNDRLDVPLGVRTEENGVGIRYFAQQGRGSFAFSWPLTEWLRGHQSGYDLVHLHSIFCYTTLVSSCIARWHGQPYVVSPHGMVEPWCLEYKAWKKWPYMKLLERPTLSASSALHALVREEEHHLRQLQPAAPIFVLPNGINPEDFTDLPPRTLFESSYPQVKGKRIVLFMGRIDPKKGIDILVKAFAEILRDERFHDLCLVIAGPDLIGYRKQIETLIRAEGIEPHVVFTGLVTGREKLAILGAADVFALPSHSEGFSMAILEALAARCPVVITEACNFPEVAANGAGAVIPTDQEQLERALINVLRDEEGRIAMGERGRGLVCREYDWAVIGRRMREVYEDILLRRRSREPQGTPRGQPPWGPRQSGSTGTPGHPKGAAPLGTPRSGQPGLGPASIGKSSSRTEQQSPAWTSSAHAEGERL